MIATTVTPTDIQVLQKDRVVKVSFDDGKLFNLSCEYLRVFSPSAETRGHGNRETYFPLDKQNINIISAEAVGNYAIKFYFDDGHDTGIYSWDYLYSLGENFAKHWQQYQEYIQQQK